jgi:pimeloyl-ACP methyl ester carboxylesterase
MLRPPPPEFVDMVVREAAKLPARAWRQILQDLMALDLGPELAAIRVPTLLLWGDGDTFVGRSDQDRLLAIPGARLVVFEGIGHDPHWEDPLRAAELVALFMARHIAPASA